MKDFSSGLLTLAGTAINYHMMNSIVDVVEFMGDFVKEKSAEQSAEKIDVVENKMIRVTKSLIDWGKATNNIALVDGKPKEMLLTAADGMNYVNADTIYDSIDDEGKAFIDTLIKEKLLERKTIRECFYVK